jgi:hypothetical protein
MRGGRNFYFVRMHRRLSERRDFCWLRRQRSLFIKSFVECIVDWDKPPNCSQKNTFGEKFNTLFPKWNADLVRKDNINAVDKRSNFLWK